MSATPRNTAAAATPPEKPRPDSAKLSEFPARSSAASRRSPAQWDKVSAVSAPTPQTQRRTAATEGEQVRPHESRRSASSCAHCLTRNCFEDTAEAHRASNSATQGCAWHWRQDSVAPRSRRRRDYLPGGCFGGISA